MSKLRPRKPDQTIKTKAGPKARRGIFSRIASGEWGKTGKAGYYTDKERRDGRGAGTYVNPQKLKNPPGNVYPPGPAARKNAR